MVDRLSPRTQPLVKPAASPTGPVGPQAPQAAKAKAAPRLPADSIALAGVPADKSAEPPSNMNNDARKLWRKAIALATDPLNAATLWTPGRPLSEGVNAHSTNTAGDMQKALESDHGYNWLEGDVRYEIDHKDKIEMRHDATHEEGSNLSLHEWLEIGNASGRGLKLDFKEGKAIPEALRTIKEVGVPDHRLMINVGDGDTEKYGELIRKELPGATIALNPADRADGKDNSDGPYEDWQLDRMIAQAEKLGKPVAFVLREDRVTEETVKKLEAVGPVSIWNGLSQGGVDVQERTKELKRWGVSGVIDLREGLDTLDKVELGLKWAKGQAQELAGKAERAVSDAASDVVDAGKDVAEGGVDLVKKGWNAIF